MAVSAKRRSSASVETSDPKPRRYAGYVHKEVHSSSLRLTSKKEKSGIAGGCQRSDGALDPNQAEKLAKVGSR